MAYLKSRLDFWPELILLVLLQLKAQEALAMVEAAAASVSREAGAPPPDSGQDPRPPRTSRAPLRRLPAVTVGQLRRPPDPLDTEARTRQPATERTDPPRSRPTRLSLAAASSELGLPGQAPQAPGSAVAPAPIAAIQDGVTGQVSLYRSTTPPPPPPRPLSWSAAAPAASRPEQEPDATTAAPPTSVPDSPSTPAEPAQPNPTPEQFLTATELAVAALPAARRIATGGSANGIGALASDLVQLTIGEQLVAIERVLLPVSACAPPTSTALGADAAGAMDAGSPAESGAIALRAVQELGWICVFSPASSHHSAGHQLSQAAAACCLPAGSSLVIRWGSPVGGDFSAATSTTASDTANTMTSSLVTRAALAPAPPTAVRLVAVAPAAGTTAMSLNQPTRIGIILVFTGAGPGLAVQEPGDAATQWGLAASGCNLLPAATDSAMAPADASGSALLHDGSGLIVLVPAASVSGCLVVATAAAAQALEGGCLVWIAAASGAPLLPGQDGVDRDGSEISIETDTIVLSVGSGPGWLCGFAVCGEQIGDPVVFSEPIDGITSAAEAITATSGPGGAAWESVVTIADLLPTAVFVDLTARVASGARVFLAIHEPAAACSIGTELDGEFGCSTNPAGMGVSAGSDLFP